MGIHGTYTILLGEVCDFMNVHETDRDDSGRFMAAFPKNAVGFPWHCHVTVMSLPLGARKPYGNAMRCHQVP